MISKFFAVSIFFTACAFANTGFHASKNGNTIPAIMQIVAKQAESIRYYEDGKLYLKAEKIYPTDAGAMLYDNSSVILLPNLSTDQTGCYLSCRSKDDYRFTCPRCGMQWWFSDDWSHLCPICQTPGE